MGMQKKYYHDQIVRDIDDLEQQTDDPGYQEWIRVIEYKSWEAFEKDLNDPKSNLVQELLHINEE